MTTVLSARSGTDSELFTTAEGGVGDGGVRRGEQEREKTMGDTDVQKNQCKV